MNLFKKQTITAKKRILVVDDLASDTQLVRSFLEERHDYTVREENNPFAALSSARDFKPHLIILDLMMPGLDGAELAASFSNDPEFKSVPIVFLTAKLSKEEVTLFGGRIGKYPFLAKPIVLTEVAACLKQQLRGI
jgi:DNA-binding response OmpR family regulator